MKITRFPQSCFLIEGGSKRILIDPGCIGLEDSFFKLWKDIDAVLITHKHSDHCSQEVIKKIAPKEIYSSREVSLAYPDMKIEIVKEGDIIILDEASIHVVHARHGYIPLLKKAGEIFENIGYIVEIGGKKAYHTSDCISFQNDYKCDVILVPVCNHGLVMGPFEAAEFAKETGASLVIPMHYDNPKFPADMEKVKEEFEKHELKYKILDLKESVEV